MRRGDVVAARHVADIVGPGEAGTAHEVRRHHRRRQRQHIRVAGAVVERGARRPSSSMAERLTHASTSNQASRVDQGARHPRRRRPRRARSAVEVAETRPARRAEVDARVAGHGQLPVEHGGDRAAVVGEHVVRSGVAPQQHSSGAVVGHVGGEPSGERHGQVGRQTGRRAAVAPTAPLRLGSPRACWSGRPRRPEPPPADAGERGPARADPPVRRRRGDHRGSGPFRALGPSPGKDARAHPHRRPTTTPSGPGARPTPPPRGRPPRWHGPTTRAARPRRCVGARAGSAIRDPPRRGSMSPGCCRPCSD